MVTIIRRFLMHKLFVKTRNVKNFIDFNEQPY